MLRLTAYIPHHPQPPAPQHAVFEPIPYYIPQPPAYSHGCHHSQGSHHSQHSHHAQSSHHSQHSQHSPHAQSSHHSQHSDHCQSGQHHDPILTIPSGTDWFDFSSGGEAGLGGWSDFSGIPSLSVSADPHRALVDMAHGLQGRTSDRTSGSASCDSGFMQRQRAYTVVDTFNPGSSAPAEVGGSAASTDAGGSAAPTEAGGSGAPRVDDLV
ncbi:protein lozenge-like [Arachis ipaensis]|uniref:Uncharacterized protein n=1 Tax=Arachis hypogaea TaxID=3818 RepID=A0A445AEG4_ARAHY|nr:protein lozenge-like [Arachis ipaensis]XP_025635677.1 protein lozenge-like [Arachis hypogaea]RYR24825.1 hypothetical protein Ahy_B02g058366 [Arachis hypogaea]